MMWAIFAGIVGGLLGLLAGIILGIAALIHTVGGAFPR